MTTKIQFRQIQWLRASIVSRAADGQPLDPDDVAALPPKFRRPVEALAEHAADLHASGERGQAQTLARDEIGGLAAALPADWEPPRLRPDPAVLAAIQRV